MSVFVKNKYIFDKCQYFNMINKYLCIYEFMKYFSHNLKYIQKIGIWFLVFLCLFLYMQNTYANTSTAYSTITLRVVALFTGEVHPVPNSWMIQLDNIRRTSLGVDSILLESSIPVSYLLSWDMAESYTWILTWWVSKSHTITLHGWDGIKTIHGVYIADDPDYWSLGLQLLIWVDTTPPPLPYSFDWPSEKIGYSEYIPFSRDAVIDTWIWLDYYSIQLSKSPTFSSVIEFSTTGTSLILAWKTLTPAVWYRRWLWIDKLWNTRYSTSFSFKVTPNWQNTVLFNEPPSSSSDPSPVSDNCPQGDISGEFFDGLCTPVIKRPFFTLVPAEHQAPSGPTWIDKLLTWVRTPAPEPYIFPNYDAPKPLTIYEYEPTYVYEDIYENNAGTSPQYPTLPYQPTFDEKAYPHVSAGLHDHLPSVYTSLSVSWDMRSHYLFYWYLHIQQHCTIHDLACTEPGVCESSQVVCYGALCPEIQRCFWYK